MEIGFVPNRRTLKVMGIFGPSLYSGDFAMDLRTSISAVVRLPFEPEELVQILGRSNPSASEDQTNEEHTTFWLVVADQFAKRGIFSDRVREKALAIIDSGEDIATLQSLGMDAAGVRRRLKTLGDLRARILAWHASNKPRNVLRKPQPLLMQIGDVLIYPTCDGENINPYYPSKEKNIHYTKSGPTSWIQNGWGAMVIVDAGRAFEFLAWYRSVTLSETRDQKPSLDSLRGDLLWRLASPGTCSATHFRKMELEKIGIFPINGEKVKQEFPGLRPGISAAAQDISIANSMKSVPPGTAIPNPGGKQKWRSPTLPGIESLLQNRP
jgi:hypothetical protein